MASEPSVADTASQQAEKKAEPPSSRHPRPHYSFFTRALHWIVARVALIQTVALFLWLAERARNETEPPLRPWIIYTHAFVGLVGSTGLSAGLLPRAALYSLTVLQIHTSYVYAFHPRLIYSRWLRTRFALRSLAASGLYLRMLGAGTVPLSDHPSRPPSFEYGLYALGVTLLSVFSAISGLLHIPPGLISVDQESQLLEQSACWPLLTRLGLDVWISGFLMLLFLASGLAYSAPLLLNNQPSRAGNVTTTLERASRLGDQFILVGVLVLTACCDLNIPYWISVGSEFWLQIRLLVDNFIIVSGILITGDLLNESRRVHAT